VIEITAGPVKMLRKNVVKAGSMISIKALILRHGDVLIAILTLA